MNSTKGSARARLLTSTLLAGLATIATPLAVTAIVTAAPTMASAQDYSSGTLIGTVTDSSGAPVADASVKVKSLAQGFERELTTDSQGQFRAALIPIGGYSVSISKAGFQPTSDGSVAVRLGGQSNYGFTLAGEGEVGAVVVTATANPQLDFEGTTTGTVIDVENLVKQVPIARNVTALSLLAPSAVAGDSAFSAQGIAQASISGASVGENIFYVNGLNITNFVNGIGAALVPFDFYKTIEVKTGGYSAEFGRGTGGVVNAVTKSGSNTFTFAVHGNYEPGSLRENAPDTFQTANRLVKSEYKDIVLEAGGPIIEDHLFFYGIYQAPKSRTTTGAILGNYYGVTKYNDTVWGAKLDGYITDRQHVELTWFDTSQERSQQRYKFTNATGVIGDKTINQINTFGGPSYVARYTGTFTDWLTISGAYGDSKFSQAAFNSLLAEPQVVDNRAGLNQTISRQTVAAGTFPSESEREFYRGDIDLYFRLVGDHHVRGGYDHEKTTLLNFSQRNGGQNWIYRKNTSATFNSLGVAPGQEYVELRTFNGGGSFSGVNQAYYIQDNWDITSRLSLNIGYRIDKFLEKDAAGQVFSEASNNKAWRLGFNFDPSGNKTDKIFGYYGRTYLPVAANTAFRAASNNIDVSQNFLPASGGLTFGALDPVTGKPVAGLGSLIVAGPNGGNNLATCSAFFISRGIVPVAGNPRGCAVGSNGTPPPPESVSALNVKSTSQDEYILGYEHRFDSLWKASVTLTYRNLLRAADDAAIDGAVVKYCAANGYVLHAADGLSGCADKWSGLNQYLILNPGEDVKAVLYDTLPGETTLRTLDLKASDLGLPKPKREYVSLQFTFDRAWDGKWSLQGSYVMSESKGNFEGAVKSDTGQADAGITSDFDTPGFLPGTYGLLPNHHGHQFKLFGAYAITDNLTFGGNASLISPRHYGCQGEVPAGVGFDDTRGSSNSYSILPAHYCQGKLVPRGSVATGDWIKRLDLSVRYAVPTKFVPAGNLVLRADVFNVFNFKGAQELYEEGDKKGGGVDPNYLKPGSSSGTVGSGYQTPRYVRFGFDLNF
ncbi:TonB-dependent receptor [Caulobacter sp. LARHSG274]